MVMRVVEWQRGNRYNAEVGGLKGKYTVKRDYDSTKLHLKINTVNLITLYDDRLPLYYK